MDEFDLPQLKEEDLPSLESILREEDNHDFFIYEELSSVLSDEIKIADDTYSVASEASIASSINVTDLLKPKHPSKHGSVLRHVILKKISSQLIDACNRRNAGLPTSIAVSNLIAVGTSHGVILIFDPIDQVLKLVLGTVSDGDKFGAITALGMNEDCSRLLSGYARGQITMWDLNNGNCIRTITDAHPIGYAVLHIQFTDDPTVAMLNDSSGSVYTLNFRRRITRTCESTCFFSGTKGEVCTMVPLHIGPNLKESPLFNSSLLAMASLTKLIVVNLKPKPTAVFTQNLAGPQECLPILNWYFSTSDYEQVKTIVPVLAFARNQTVLFYKVSKCFDVYSFTLHQTMKLHYKLISMSWINSQLIVTIDTCERIRVIDVCNKEEIECLDLASMQMVYGSSYFKCLATGGNVSKALKAASCYACYQSVQVYNGQLLILGTKSIHCLNVRHWTDRLDYFVKRNEHFEALELAKLFYEGKGRGVIGLNGNRKMRKSLVSNEIVRVLLSYLDVGITVNCPKTNDEFVLKPYFRRLVTTSIDYCLLIHNLDLLFCEVYERFSDDEIIKNEFLQGLEEYILDGKLMFLSAIVMKSFIEYFEKTFQLKKLEDCLVHLDLQSVDLNYIVKLCWTHRLYNLVIYVYNKGFADYLTPVEKLIKILQDSLNGKDFHLDNNDIILGNKILVYISCCLAGNQFPIGRINAEKVSEVKADVYNWLTTEHSDMNISQQTYPYLRILLMFDTREFLNVLSIAFEEREFEPENEKVGALLNRQKMVNILLSLMVNNDSFSPYQIGCLFTFLARKMAKHEKSIKVSRFLFEQVLEYLCNPDEQSRHGEREEALLELLAAGGLHHFSDEQVLTLAESAKFYRVCEVLYQSKHQYEKVLSCYWRDSTRKIQAFEYIDRMLIDDSLTDFEKEEICHAIMSSLFQLAEVNSMKLARLILHHFHNHFNEVVKRLKSRLELQYTFLKGVLEDKSNNSKTADKLSIDTVIYEQFIDLMCTYEPCLVLSYLQSNYSYRLEQTLAIVRPKKLIHSTSYLLERMGDIPNAFKLLFDDLKLAVDDLNVQYSHNIIDNERLNKTLVKAGKALQASLKICQRTSQHLKKEDCEAMWFPLLETVMAPQRHIKDAHSDHFLVFKEFTKDVLGNMMSYISLPAVLQKIMLDQTYSNGKLGEIKDLVTGMLDTYNYEVILLETTNGLLGKDLHGQYFQEKKILCQGLSPIINICQICFRTFDIGYNSDGKEMILFRCGHVYHCSCLQGIVGYNEELRCIQCNKNSIIHTVEIDRITSHKNSRLELSKSVINEKKKSKVPAVQLSKQQESALNVLWNKQSIAFKYSHSFDVNPSQSIDKRSNKRLMIEPNVYFDDNVTLRLAPPFNVNNAF